MTNDLNARMATLEQNMSQVIKALGETLGQVERTMSQQQAVTAATQHLVARSRTDVVRAVIETITSPDAEKLKRAARRHVWSRWAANSGAVIGEDPKFNFRTDLTGTTTVGANFNSNGLQIRGGGEVVIGDNFHCGTGCIILTENHNYLGEAVPYDTTYIRKRTVIGDNVWFGVQATVMPGVSIGEGAILQAGAVVVRDVAPLAIVGGSPATEFAQRDRAHYEQRVREGKFH